MRGICAVLVAALAAGLAGCGPDGPEEEQKREPSASEEDCDRGGECEDVNGDADYGRWGDPGPYDGDDTGEPAPSDDQSE